MCNYCRDEADKCGECGGTSYHLGDCSKRKPIDVRSKLDLDRMKPEARERIKVWQASRGFPCIVCGGEFAHAKIDGEVVCHKITEAVEATKDREALEALADAGCEYCGGITKHWAPCSVGDGEGPMWMKSEAERVEIASKRVAGFKVPTVH